MKRGIVSVGALIIFVAVVFAIFTLYSVVSLKANPPIRPASAYLVEAKLIKVENATSGSTSFYNYTLAITVVNSGGVALELRAIVLGMRPQDLEGQAMVRLNGTEINPWSGKSGAVGSDSYVILVNETLTSGYVLAEEEYFLPQGATGRMALDISTWSSSQDAAVFPEGEVIYGYLVFDGFAVQFSFVGEAP